MINGVLPLSKGQGNHIYVHLCTVASALLLGLQDLPVLQNLIGKLSY